MLEKPSWTDIRDFRRRSIVNGYGPIRVKDRDKRPVAKNWTNGEPCASLTHSYTGSNTGLLASGLRVIDIDIDDAVLVQKVISEMRDRLPRGAIIRKRSNSSRLAVVYKAAAGKPGKLKVTGPAGAVEVLGDGQQFVAHGIHPSGAIFEWLKGKSPASVSVSALAIVTEAALLEFMAACERLLAVSGLKEPANPLGVTHAGNVAPPHGHMGAQAEVTHAGNRPTDHVQPQQPATWVGVTHESNTAVRRVPRGVDPSVTSTGNLPRRSDPHGEAKKAADELGAGIEAGHWFSKLQPHAQEELVRACLNAIGNTKNDPRDGWLGILFAVADAERQGCPNARALALEWSRRGARWTSEADFDAAWASAKPGGGITIGTLIFQSQSVGMDISRFRQRIPDPQADMPADWSPKATSIAEFCEVPPKRQFVLGTDIIRGAVTVIVAPGARGKTSLLTAMAISCASNTAFLHEPIYGGPLRVLYINAEDPKAELWRRFYAALTHHNIASSDCTNLNVLGAEHGAFAFLENYGGQPRLNQLAWREFERNLAHYKPDVVFIDPLAAVFGGVSMNDNSAASLLMAEFTRIAARYKIAIVIAHHSAKGRDLTSPEAAMGGAMTMNFARVGLSIEPMTVEQAVEFGITELDAAQYFRLIGTKQNMSLKNTAGRWHRLVQVHIPNAEPPTYPLGDTIAVVERANPTKAGLSGAMTQAVLSAIAAASPPLSPVSGRPATDPIPVIEAAMGPYMGGRTTRAHAKAVLKQLRASGKVLIGRCQVSRSGRGGYERDALVVPGLANAMGTP